MRAYISVFKLRFILLLQYRAAAFAGLCTQFAFGAMHIMVMMAYYKAVGKCYAYDSSTNNQLYLAYPSLSRYCCLVDKGW